MAKNVNKPANTENPQWGYEKAFIKPDYFRNGRRMPPPMVPLPPSLLPFALRNNVDPNGSTQDFLK